MLTLNDLFQGFRQPDVIRALAAQIIFTGVRGYLVP